MVQIGNGACHFLVFLIDLLLCLVFKKGTYDNGIRRLEIEGGGEGEEYLLRLL